MKRQFVFTSESVTQGHPDKLCDLISDTIVDHYLASDPYARIITECAIAKGVAFIAARFACELNVDIAGLARAAIASAGYSDGEFGPQQYSILTNLSSLPATARLAQDLGNGEVDDDRLERLVARHQVTVFGFACRQTAVLMPAPIWLAHRLARQLDAARLDAARLDAARLEHGLDYLTPDGTIQVGVEYRDGRPYRVSSLTLVVSQQAEDNPTPKRLRDDIIERVIEPVFAEQPVRPDAKTRIFVNPDGPRVGGGPGAHAGLTGRKTAADTYGGYARQGGSALSGKDSLRIDRVAAYAARYAAKNIVAAGLAEQCEVQLSYSIGLAGPVSLQVETFGTASAGLDDDELARRLEAVIDFRFGAIIRAFDLCRRPQQGPFYQRLAAYGQVGRDDLDSELPWELTDCAPALRQ